MSASKRTPVALPLPVRLVGTRKALLVRRALPQPLSTFAAVGLSLVLHVVGAVLIPYLASFSRPPDPAVGVRVVSVTLPTPAKTPPPLERHREIEPLDVPPEPRLEEPDELALLEEPFEVLAEPLPFEPLFRPQPRRKPEVPPEVPPPPPPPPPPEPEPPEPRPMMEVRDHGEPVTVTAPVPLDDNTPPRYPTLARRRNQEGLVVVLALIDTTGAVTAVSVQRSSGYPLLDRAALEAVRSWRFRPAREGDVPVSGEREVPIRFVLVN